MKKIVSICITLAFILTGCSIVHNNSVSDMLTSEVTLDIYPENGKYELVDKFDRVEYNRLSDAQKRLYTAMDNAVYSMKTGYINLGNSTAGDVDLVYHALRNDRPEYFWLPSSYTLRSSGSIYEICFAEKSKDWLYTREERLEYEQKIKDMLADFLESIDQGLSEFDRELTAHDILAEHITYDSAALTSSATRFHAWNIIGAFCHGKAVCEGYSRAMQIMCFMLGINCSVVTGTVDEPHMWNLVKIDGNWYHLDLTSDDGDNGIYHFFFNVTTEYMLKSRTIDPLFTKQSGTYDKRFNTFLPPCTATEHNYHIAKSLYIADISQTESTVVSLLCDAVRSGQRSVEFAAAPETGFVFGEQDVARVFKLERCISAANAELPVSKQLRSYSYGGGNGALGFVLSW